MITNKYERETSNEYIARICSYKDSFGLNWEQIKDICNKELGNNYTESYYRKNYKRGLFGKKTDTDSSLCIVDSLQSDDEDETEEQRLESLLKQIKEERIRLSDERVSNNAALRRLVREDTCKDIAEMFAEKMGSKKLLPSVPPHRYTKISENKAILVISDWHYGIDINSRFNVYNPEICRERVATLLNETNALCDANSVSELYVVNLADLISGRIHAQIRIQNREDVITQIMEVSEIVAELISELALKRKVHYVDCLDNHSRVEPNKNEHIDLESLCRITPWYLKLRFASNKNVVFHENEFGEDIITFECNGFSIAGVHGDKDSPTKVNANISLLTQQHYDLILTAHLHHFSADEHTRTVIISNGSLMGQDDYAKKLRLDCAPSQNLIIVSNDNVVRALYRIVV